jgi:hypothetical protein
VSPKDLHAFVNLDDLDADTRARLIAIRATGDLCLYATELGMARAAIKATESES